MVASAGSGVAGQGSAVANAGGWGGTAARAVSMLLSPPLVAIAAAAVSAQQAGDSRWLWVACYSGIAVLLPFVYLLWLVRTGKVTDVDVYRREQRLRPLAVAVLGTVAAWVILRLAAAPEALLNTASAVAVQMLLVSLVTTRWKISMHTSAAAGMVVTALHYMGTGSLPVVMVAPLVTWSRLRLRRHTPGQVAAGLALGAVVFATTLALLEG